jgi:hypothetical protein
MKLVTNMLPALMERHTLHRAMFLLAPDKCLTSPDQHVMNEHRADHSENHANFLVRQGQFHTGLLLGSFSVSRTPFEQELSQLLSGGMRQSKRSHLVTGVIVFLAQLFSDFETRVGVVFEEAQEILTLDEVDLARVDGLGGQFIGLARNRGTKTQNFTRFGNFQDQGFAVGRANGELHTPLAKHKNAARRLSLDK